MVNELGNMDDLELMPLGSSYMVRRDRLMNELIAKGRKAGIVVLYAPDGFGKTSVLLQYAQEVKSDPTRGPVRIIEADRAIGREVFMQLEVVTEELKDKPHSLIAIDNVPNLSQSETEELIDRIRSLRAMGVGVFMSCRPSNRQLIHGLGDSIKVNAQMLKVHAYEYSAWASAFSISTSLDFYQLTQGVPELVSAMQSGLYGQGDVAQTLENEIVNIYGAALVDLASLENNALFSVACLMVLMGEGNISELEACGVRLSAIDQSYLVRDYPIFGVDPADRSFTCMGTEDNARLRLRKLVAEIRPELVVRAARILIKAGRCDTAMDLADAFLDRSAVLELAGQYGVDLALTGHGGDVCRAALGKTEADGRASEPTPDEALGIYLAAVSVSNAKLARYMASIIERAGEQAICELDPVSWKVAHAFTAACYGDSGLGLPVSHTALESEASCAALDMLSAHVEIKHGLTERAKGGEILAGLKTDKAYDCELDIAGTFVRADRMLTELFDGSYAGTDERDDEMSMTLEALEARGIRALVIWVRMVLSARRLLAGMPVTDEQAFNELDRFAVRVRDNQVQLFGLILEGWQSLAEGRPVNAKFRAVQVLRLAEESIGYIRDNALLLERAAYLRNTSMVSVREEAELLDLSRTQVGGAEAWMVALHLASAGRDSDLAAWMSMNRQGILDPSYRLFARLAMHCLGEPAARIRKKLPVRELSRYSLRADFEGEGERLFQAGDAEGVDVVDHIEIRMFGAFRAERDGFPITDKMWRRKKAATLAERLALGMDALVDRETLAMELWPHAEFNSARNNLYSTISRLRSALGPTPDGKSCVLIQNECIGLNGDYVKTDVRLFDQISREVLGNRTGARGPHLIELCLKIEQLYAGPLYVPNGCNPTYFLRMRRIMESKYIDCMIRGANAALEENDLQSAVWLVESGLRQETAREDMVRCAMRVYGAAGRRRDIVELYSGHMHHLREQINGVPEPETRRLYERLVEGRLNRVLVER
ncbi:Bacterial transcriptional activator domain protein [Collinsella aerofaciens]|uniref:Bacterial transcriptional activator domain protein n=1 Tax=Collinsella aerofaciens TaxID=74426 RepID=A0A6N3AXI9_9ACTN